MRKQNSAHVHYTWVQKAHRSSPESGAAVQCQSTEVFWYVEGSYREVGISIASNSIPDPPEVRNGEVQSSTSGRPIGTLLALHRAPEPAQRRWTSRVGVNPKQSVTSDPPMDPPLDAARSTRLTADALPAALMYLATACTARSRRADARLARSERPVHTSQQAPREQQRFD